MLKQWRNPKTLDELTQIFLDHLHTKISTTPFSPTPLSPESLTILQELEQLTKRGWWTVGSQPTVNGTSSSDKTVGWGPKGGYVFQKGFVEFFCEEKDVRPLQKNIEEHGKGWVHYFAGNYKVRVVIRTACGCPGSECNPPRETTRVTSQKTAGML